LPLISKVRYLKEISPNGVIIFLSLRDETLKRTPSSFRAFFRFPQIVSSSCSRIPTKISLPDLNTISLMIIRSAAKLHTRGRMKLKFMELLEEEGEEKASILADRVFSDNFHQKYNEKKKYERLFKRAIKKLEEQAKDSVDKKIADNIEEQEKAELLSDEDFQRAEAMAKRPDIMGEIFTDIKKLGVVGEETNTVMVYLAGTSRKMKKPLKLNLRGDTCTGKNTIVNKVIDLFPKDEVIDASRMSKQALAYM
jgi:hypothetical protein